MLLNLFWVIFILHGLLRYVRLIVNCFAHWTFKPIPIPEAPTYGSHDVTVIIPTLDGDTPELRETVTTCLRTNPSRIILVTVETNRKRALGLADAVSGEEIRVLCIPQANKRLQMCEAIPEVNTRITVFADDDVLWPRTLLPWILAPFEDPYIGGVGTCQRLRRAENPNFSKRIWNFLGAIYLERRNFDIAACTRMDGGVPCLSGRTVAYRTKILQDDAFKYEFTHETWRTYQLNADDDNFLTRWMVSQGWKTYIQYHKEAEVLTTLEDTWWYLKQCLRWVRSNWRSNLTSMFVERHVWRLQPWSTYAVHQTTLTAWAPLNDGLLLFELYRAAEAWSLKWRAYAIVGLISWILLTKFVKLLGHFIRYPVDLLLFPVQVFFAYGHSLIKFYGMLSLDVTTWGSRENADADDAMRMIPLPPYS